MGWCCASMTWLFHSQKKLFYISVIVSQIIKHGYSCFTILMFYSVSVTVEVMCCAIETTDVNSFRCCLLWFKTSVYHMLLFWTKSAVAWFCNEFNFLMLYICHGCLGNTSTPKVKKEEVFKSILGLFCPYNS